MKEITLLIERLRRLYGNKYVPWGTYGAETEGTGFRIEGIKATFSIGCPGDTQQGTYDIQVESDPPGDYLYNTELDLDPLLDFIELYRGPTETWP